MDINVLERSTVVSLSAREIEDFKQLAKCINMKPGQMIFQEDESAQFVYLIASGYVKIFRCSPLGEVVTVGIRNKGDVMGVAEVLSGINRRCFAEVLEASELWKMEGKSFIEMLYKNPALAVKVTTVLGTRLREAEQTILNLVTLEVDRRLAKLLIDLAQKHPALGEKGLKINLKLTQQELATMIGTCRQTVTTTLQKFKSEGLINSGKKSIEIINMEGLKNFADSKVLT
ncbi:MAG: Crp/Fnr family transcriptional regulator [Desulfitobacterium hafniense]|nr:Crp/Fnr family transcriptional regulator [Desulfitobacterium hafniense]